MSNHACTDPFRELGHHRMTPAGFRLTRESLGLPQEWLAASLGVPLQIVDQWEQGERNIPESASSKLEQFKVLTDEFVGRIVDKLLDMPDPFIITYRSDREYFAYHPRDSFPASWHRAAVARIIQEVPGLCPHYPDGISCESAA